MLHLSIDLYGYGIWTLRKAHRNYHESFEMWCWRRIEKTICTDRVTDEAVMQRVEDEMRILYTVQEARITASLIPRVGTGL